MTQQEKELLIKALEERGYYNSHSVFHHEPEIYKEPENSRYEYRADIVKWNTKSTRMTRVGCRWNTKKNKWVLSTYKTGSIKRQKHGEKMR